ncbi:MULTISPECIES: hypothetical protein [Myroides]|uniref:Lipoprotein n=1 Tax=Myroides albus TaxID=2562892 RepID=A0A6I3LLV9_9FLAO|nr:MULTISPECIES: hypothetical protein [Myroides]MTG99353.1 hypothetical protein [Myroides albus]MVX34347.1 hypothetical protein [Myroides sp. LoEW2-1]
MKKIYVFILAFIIVSCNNATTTKEVSYENEFTVTVPSMMREGIDLNEEADLQLSNGFNELYLIVLSESKQDFDSLVESELRDENDTRSNFEWLVDITKSSVLDSCDLVYKEGSMKDSIINGIEMKYTSIEAKVVGIDILYHYAWYNSRNKYYQILSWTLLSKKDKYNDVVRDMTLSFKEK